ncbi:GNAT family N-acetyltransferase [Microbacterium sp. GXF7504]
MTEGPRIRPAGQGDGAFLADMVVEAANWRDGAARPRHQVLADRAHSRYITGWMRPGDAGSVALDEHDEPVGAAWYRTFPRSEPGFGHVGTGVPELIIGVRPIWRSHGVGRSLLRALVTTARAEGYARLCLSVETGNFARALYRSEGFEAAGEDAGRETMVLRLR